MSRVLLMAAALLLLCTGAYFLLREKPLPPIEAAEQIWIASYDADEIESLIISPKDSISYPLVRTERGMRLMGQEDMQLRDDVVEEMLEAAGHLEAQEVIGRTDETDVPLAAFGLEEPELKAVLMLADGTKKEISFGDYVPQTDLPQYYCLADGVLYTVLAEPCDVLFHDAEYLRYFEQPQLQTDLIDRVDVTGEVTLSVQYTHDGFRMEAPWEYPANEAKVNTLLSNIGRMAFEAYLGKPEENDLAALGLDAPALTVVITQAPSIIAGETQDGEQVTIDVPETKYTLLLGKDNGESAVYVCWEGGVYKASNFLLGFWKEMQPAEYLSQTPMNITVEKLQSLSVKTEKEEAVYQVEMVESVGVDNQIETDEYGRTLYDAQVKKDGKGMDASSFLSWYVQLNRLKLSGRVKEGWQAEGEPLATVTLLGSAGQRQVAFYPYDSLHAVMTVNGTGLYYLEKTALSLLDNLP